MHQQAGDAKAARTDLDEALKIFLARPRPSNYAQYCGQQQRLRPGHHRFKRAVEDRAEKSPELLGELATLYEANKQPRKAIAAYNDVLHVDSENFEALRGRADAYLNTGDHADAVTDYEAALKMKPDNSSILNNLAWVLATSPKRCSQRQTVDRTKHASR